MSDTPDSATLDPRFTSAIELLRSHANLRTFAIGYDDDVKPTVWWVMITRRDGSAEVDAALHPLHAMLRLCGRLLDGCRCPHCGKVSLFATDDDDMLLGSLFGGCVIRWDPDSATWRGCW